MSVSMNVSSRTSAESAALLELRARLDALDDELVDLIERRASVVDDVVRAKARAGVPTFVPEREAEIVARAIRRSRGVVKPDALVRVIHEVLAASRARALVPRVVYLGPEGSMSHAATVARFGPDGGRPHDTLSEVVRAVAEGEAELGVVPVENSTTGRVDEGLAPLEAHGDAVRIVDEVVHHVRYALWAASASVRPQRILAHPQARAQCAAWFGTHLPDVAWVATTSSSRAVSEVAAIASGVADGTEGPVAALASLTAGLVHGLVAIATDIQDIPDNHTRFVIIARRVAHSDASNEVRP